VTASSSVIEPADEALCTQVEDEIVFLTQGEKPIYFGLRGSAVRIWRLIEERALTEDDIVARLLAEFDADEATVRKDVAETLDGLARRDVIKGR